jgi:hypothetical protein
MMNLQLACVWLYRYPLRLSDVHWFAARCRQAARVPNRESGALLLLANAALSFTKEHEGERLRQDVVQNFREHLRDQALQLCEASAGSDAQFIGELNRFGKQLRRN